MSGNSGASDIGVGRALLSTRIQLTLQAMYLCFWFGFIPCFSIPMYVFFENLTPQEYDIVKLDIIGSIIDKDTVREWKIRDDKLNYKIIAATTTDHQQIVLLNSQQLLKAISSISQPIKKFHASLLISLILGLIGLLSVLYGLRQFGAKSQESKRIRGALQVVDAKTLNSLVLKQKPSSYKLVDVMLPSNAPTTGILAQGSQGSGKSLAIHDLMQQVFRKKRKCIIYDQNGEFYRAYFRPGKDVFFNPACLGSVPWSIFEELKYVYDTDSLAQAFLPPKDSTQSGPNSFFEDAARALFSVIILRLKERGAQNTKDIATAFFDLPDEEIEKLIEKSIASSAVGGDSKAQRQGVISSIAIYLNGIASVKEGNWSIRDFLNKEDDSRLFIVNSDDTKAMFAPLYRLILSVSFDLIAAKQEVVHTDRYWYFLDEVHTLGDIKLDDHLATKRKFGVSIVTGIQSQSQFISSMGKERGDTVMNCFNSLLVLRANDWDMQESAAQRLGKVEMKTINSSNALAPAQWRDGAGLATTEGDKWLIMPSELGALDDCNGYIKLVGSFPTAKVDYSKWLKKGFFSKKSYADKFEAIQPSPERDPSFIIGSVETNGMSALESVKADVQSDKDKDLDKVSENKAEELLSVDQTQFDIERM